VLRYAQLLNHEGHKGTKGTKEEEDNVDPPYADENYDLILGF
jgi:hypothetical protein